MLDWKPERCGEKHPTIPGVTCISFGGKCPIDWHVGVDKRDARWYEFCEWGKAFEEANWKLPKERA